MWNLSANPRPLSALVFAPLTFAATCTEPDVPGRPSSIFSTRGGDLPARSA